LPKKTSTLPAPHKCRKCLAKSNCLLCTS
jgi:hypothetical protein